MTEREPRFFFAGHEYMTRQIQEDEMEVNQVLALKREMHEVSRNEGAIRDLGPISDLSPKTSWHGKISVISRLASGDLTRSEIEQSVESVNDFFAPTKPGSRVRCIDGRPLTGYNDSSIECLLKDLGPQVPGGTPAQALCYRLATEVEHNDYEISLYKDMMKISKIQSNTGFSTGNHSDSSNYEAGNNKTGCGAVDSIEGQLKFFAPEPIERLKGMTNELLGDEFEASSFEYIADSAVKINDNLDKYLLQKRELFKELKRENPDSIAVLEGTHNEILLTINTIENTTFNRDHYSAANNNKIQGFNYDVWYDRVVAKEISEDKTIQSRFFHARVATAVATLIILTDGSPRLLIREAKTRLN